MIFVPLPLFATFVLLWILIRLIKTKDMSQREHRLFALVVGLYALQSFLLCLRWGYGVSGAAPWIAMLAPCLPAFAYLAYNSLSSAMTRKQLWPLAVIALNWTVYALHPALADPFILLTYIGFGGLLLALAWGGSDNLPLTRFSSAGAALSAIQMTGAALLASGLTDIYLIYDFLQNNGQNAAIIVTFVQSAVILAIGLGAALGQSAITEDPSPTTQAQDSAATQEDSEIVARLSAILLNGKLYRDEDLTLRRLSRKMGLPDRSVSQAVNRKRGINLSQFVNEFRVQDACELLRSTDKTILEISLTAGFATKSNFNREFTRVTGQTPSAWRSRDADLS